MNNITKLGIPLLATTALLALGMGVGAAVKPTQKKPLSGPQDDEANEWAEGKKEWAKKQKPENLAAHLRAVVRGVSRTMEPTYIQKTLEIARSHPDPYAVFLNMSTRCHFSSVDAGDLCDAVEREMTLPLRPEFLPVPEFSGFPTIELPENPEIRLVTKIDGRDRSPFFRVWVLPLLDGHSLQISHEISETGDRVIMDAGRGRPIERDYDRSKPQPAINWLIRVTGYVDKAMEKRFKSDQKHLDTR